MFALQRSQNAAGFGSDRIKYLDFVHSAVQTLRRRFRLFFLGKLKTLKNITGWFPIHPWFRNFQKTKPP